MKKIIIPIFHGHTARNILRTEVLNCLLNEGVEVILIVPAIKKESYEREFGKSKVRIESTPRIVFSKIDRLFRYLYYYFVDTKTVLIIQREQFQEDKQFRYVFTRLMTLLFGNIKFLRKIVRSLDYHLVLDKTFISIFNKHKPDLVFIPSVTSDEEMLVLREAKKRNIPSVGMIRSWDNITVNKGNLRIVPDLILVHSEILKKDVIKYLDYPKDKIIVVGMSHFDYYLNSPFQSRKEFFARVGGDASKKTVYFMPIGLSDSEQDKKMLSFIEKMLKEPRIDPAQLMVSSHPNTNKKINYHSSETILIKFPGFISYPEGKLTDREITRPDMELMASAIYHSDVIINYQGTTTIDAAAFDKPVINIAFDDIDNKPYLKSVRRLYDFTHYLPILESGGVRIAYSKEQLFDFLLQYINNPELDSEGRRKMFLEQNGGFELGEAGLRTARAILSMVI